MPSMDEAVYVLRVQAKGPIAVLPRRTLRAAFPLPRPLLRSLGPGEQADGSPWSEWLAGWGWAWAVTPDACTHELPLLDLWLARGQWPRGFDARALALAVALRLRVDGKPLEPGPAVIGADVERVWRTLSGMSGEALGEALALALLRADAGIFQFGSACPQWPADISRVVRERRALVDEREPLPAWLRMGYALLGDAFDMLRSLGSTLDECQEVWDAFARGRNVPWAFEMAFWWEATYCLTERHAYEAAARAQERVAELVRRLEAVTGLVDPMWHHQQGRLFYYAGNHESALAEFLREYRGHGEGLDTAAMLERELANVLSDLGCLEAAHRFAGKSVELARMQGQKSEVFKSLGRLAEISLKRGNIAGAAQWLQQSLDVQEKFGEDRRAPAQTLTYLGHAAVLAGDPDAAVSWYDRAMARDESVASLPYIVMGRFAVAAATGNAVALDHLWNAHSSAIQRWQDHMTHALPAAVCTLAASHLRDDARRRLPSAVRALVEKRYVIEAAWALNSLPEQQADVLADEIVAVLNRWQRVLASLPADLREVAGPLDGPALFIEAIRRKRLRDSPALAVACYPMTLAEFKQG